jgi:hypothetical protein
MKRLGEQLAPRIRKACDPWAGLMLKHPEAFDDPELIRAGGRAYRRGGWDAIRDLRPTYERGGRRAVIAAVATSATAQRGHAPRPASNQRLNGSRRGERSSSSSSDDPDGESDGEPPGRTCACGCGASVEHRHPDALYLNQTHAGRYRQRRLNRRRAERADRVRERLPTWTRDAVGTFLTLSLADRCALIEAAGVPRSEIALRLLVTPRQEVAA